MKKILLFFFPLAAAAALAAWLVKGVSLGNFTGKAALLLSFGRLAGIAGALGLAWQLLGMSRARWLEPLYGAVLPVKAHHRAGLALPLVLLVHIGLVVGHYSLTGGRGFLTQLGITLGWEDAAAAACGLGLIILAVTASLPALRKKLPYPVWKRLHLLTYLGLALSLGHQFALGGDLAGADPWFAGAWVAIFAFTAVNAAWWRLLKPRFTPPKPPVTPAAGN